MDVLPALLGVGFICGKKITSYLFAGGVLSWFVILPMITFFGTSNQIFPANLPIYELDSWGIWSMYVRYIGAGCLVTGGVISLIKSIPLLVDTFRKSLGSFSIVDSAIRTDRDLPIRTIFILLCLMIILMVALPSIPIGFLGTLLVIVFGFFFATVSSRMVGLVGSSNNPVSGMTIATVLFTSIIFVMIGNTGHAGMISTIAIASIVCIISAIAGDTSQDLKTGYILGATPTKQQIGEFIGVIASALAICGILYLLNSAWGFGSAELGAPQATLMKIIAEGVMLETLPWNLIFMCIGCGIMAEIIGIPVLPFAIGIYLPIHMTSAMMVGGIIRYFFEKSARNKGVAESDLENEDSIANGVLISSGFIAGEGLVGIILAILAVLNINISVSDIINLGDIGSIIAFIVLVVTLIALSKR